MKTIRLFLVLMTFLVITNVLAQNKKDLCVNNSKAMQTLGGVASEGNLRIYIYDNANMQVYRYVSGNWQNQWYGTSSKSTRLYAGGIGYAGSGGYFSSGATALTMTSNTNPDANTNVLIMDNSGKVRVKQTTYYPAGSTNIYYTFEITNLSASTLNDLRFFSGGDTYLQGGDNGGGFWIGMDNTIGVKKTIGTNLQKLNMQGITIPYAYESDNYYNVYQSVNANALTNVLDPNEATDNGMALEYRIASLAAGSTWTIQAVEKFNASPITNVIVTAPLSGQVAPGNTLDLNFTLQNRTSSATSVTLIPTIDLSGWSVALISPASPYNLAANATQTINLRVTCPAGATLGTTAKITLTATDASGSASDFTNVTAAAVPTINTHPTNQSLCASSPATFSITATNANTYQWQEYTTSWANISNGGIYSGATTANLSISSVTSGMNNYQYRCFVSNAYGNATSNNGVLTIGSSPSITSQPSASTICNGNNTSFAIAVSGSGISYQWQVNDGSGFANITNGGVYDGATTNTLSLTGATTAMSGYQYKCNVSNSCSAGISSNTVALTVNTLPAITSQPSASTICEGNNTSFAIIASGTSYQWQVNNGSGFSNISNGGVYSGATTNTLSITGVANAMNDYQYRCVVSGSCPPAATSDAAILTVYALTSITSQPSASAICEGNNTGFSVSASGAGLTYQWQVDAKAGYYNIIDGGVYSGATTSNLSISGANYGMNEYQYRCVVSSNCAADITTNSAELTINRAPYIGLQPTSSTICAGENTSFSLSALGNGLTYQWQVNNGSGYTDITNGGVYSGSTSNTLTISGVTEAMNGYEYQCIINGTCSPNSTSDAVLLNVNSLTSISSQPISSTICEGDNTSYNVSASGAGITYQWQVNDGSGFTNISDGGVYSGATTSTLDISGNTYGMNGYEFRCEIIGTCSTMNSNIVTLTINTLPSISSQANSATICEGENTSFEISASGTAISYQWQVNDGSGFVNVTDGGVYSGATTNTLSLSAVTNTMNAYEYKCIVSGTCNPSVASDVVLLTVNALASISTQPSASTVCEGSNTSFDVTASGAGLSYQWQVNEGSGFVNITDGGVYSGSTTNSLIVTGAIFGMNGYDYRCEINGTCSYVTSNSAMLSINTLPTISSQPSSSTICENENTSFAIIAAGTAISYQWQVNEGSGFIDITDGGVYSGATTNTLSLSAITNTMNAFEYKCIVSGTCNPNVSSDVVLLTVNTAPSISGQPLSSSICDGENTNYNVTASGTNLTYQWQVNEGSGFVNITNGIVYGGATTNLLTISKATYSMNGFEYQCVVNGTCTPEITTDAVSLTIFELPVVDLGDDVILCENQTITLDAGPGTNYIWSLPVLSGQIVTIDYEMLGLGAHTVSVTVTNSNNCEAADAIEITYTVCTSINKTNDNTSISVQPNPTSGLVYINFPSSVKEAEIEIYNVQGKVVKNEKVFDATKTQIDMSNMAKGAYTIRIVSENKIINKKLIVN